MSRSRSLNKLFNEAEGGLAKVIARTAALSAIADQVSGVIPSLLRDQVWLGDIRDQTLTLICNSNVIANRLRFMEYQLLNELSGRNGLGEIHSLRVMVNRDWRPGSELLPRPAEREAGEISQRAERLSDASAELIAQTSEGVRSPKLAEALKKLADRSGH